MTLFLALWLALAASMLLGYRLVRGLIAASFLLWVISQAFRA